MIFNELTSLLEVLVIHLGKLVMAVDFNFHVDVPSDCHATKLLTILDSLGFMQYSRGPHIKLATLWTWS